MAGRADAYSVVTGTSTTPPTVPGAIASYSVRSDVTGSAWAIERQITYPATPAPAPAPASAPTPAPAPAPAGAFEPGVVAGSALMYELPFIKTLAASTARLEFDINTPVATMAPIIDAYAKAGIRPLLLAGLLAAHPRRRPRR